MSKTTQIEHLKKKVRELEAYKSKWEYYTSRENGVIGRHGYYMSRTQLVDELYFKEDIIKGMRKENERLEKAFKWFSCCAVCIIAVLLILTVYFFNN